jgi:tRNA-specific 2-thiouridylase
VEPFVADYLAGRTPVPCTLCNNFIKFDQFLEMADAVGAHHIATGHYARITHNETAGRYEMRRAVDASKDQTYFLFGLTQPQLARTLFPLGGRTKSEVREMARDMELAVANKGESYEICFVPNGDYAQFIAAYLKDKQRPAAEAAGTIVDSSGAPRGRHEGVHHFTVGQRKGLGISAPDPLYVISTDPQTQTVTIGSNDQLLRSTLTANRVNWIAVEQITAPTRAEVKIRHPAPATLYPLAPDRVEVRFDEPQRAVTPGQAAVFYQGDLVLGGGWIE